MIKQPFPATHLGTMLPSAKICDEPLPVSLNSFSQHKTIIHSGVLPSSLFFLFFLKKQCSISGSAQVWPCIGAALCN